MHAAWERWDSFWVAGVRRGAVFRAFDGGLLTTRVAFQDATGTPFASESLVRLTDDGETWRAYRYRQEPGGLGEGLRRDESGLGVDTLPASGEYLLVAQFAASSRGMATYLRVDEACPDAAPAPAQLRRGGAEPVDLPDGRSIRAERLDVTAGGMRVATYWAHDGGVVRTASAGTLAFACPGDREALAGIAPRLGAFLREGFGG
ncbi:hypothetical protein [Sinomonas sp. R1AF57]|uniref:hypothetical protein n=1 Tax=Sinomonas sp. R1AF57 TaxID=2020377 RepID=UPI000B614800|nr:hypothetical protein [Sinomonas sp. R1AF57]ASN51836.1 hypothetical protein CGQ25_06910 [Sinomonas sp. R1AF57]